MVEGPGTTRNGRKASRLLTKQVRNLRIGNADGNSTNNRCANAGSSQPLPWWNNRHLSQVITIGKELFLIFSLTNEVENETKTSSGDHIHKSSTDDLAIRVHFGMSGSLHVNNRTTQPQRNDPITLDITFDSHILRTYNTNSVSKNPIPALAPRRKYERLHTHDVCSPTFNVQHVLDYLSPHLSTSATEAANATVPSSSSSLSTTIISDILLNQYILPGIGNVIKIEGLHEARIHPKRLLHTLTRDELYHLIICCRNYSIKWLEEYKSPAKYVYNQTICGTCFEASIAICRLGGTDRTTFWCTKCQRMDGYPNQSIDHSSAPSSASASRPSSSPSLQERTMVSNINLSTSASARTCKVCPTHGPKNIILRRCKKRGTVNEDRIFYTCKARDRGRKSCNYFSWADTTFPKCKCGKKVIMRVSKTEQSGGKWFFFCANRKSGSRSNNGCGYFQWVDPQTLQRFGNLLTPLL